MKSKYLMPLLSTVLLWSCSKEQTDITSANPSNPSIEMYSSKGVDVKISFAQVIAKAVTNPAVRQLLESKASLQFDKDYDVLYHQIKNDKVGGRTLDEYIKELSSESDYNLFTQSPLLTVFIPHSPQTASKTASTSPENPWVAVRDHDDKLVAYNSAGERKELDESILPKFPVMVVKENERVVYENNVKKEALKGHFLFESDGNRYYFGNDEFDGNVLSKAVVANTTTPSQARLMPASAVDPEVMTAYRNGLTCNTCPQRDWVYYGIYPPGGANQGTMNIKYAEAITSVQFENTNAFTYIGGWDEGNYELYVSVFFSGASTGVFSSVLKVITVSRSDMFEFDSNNNVTAVKTYQPSNLYTIAPWDMQAYGNTWAFKVEEYDPEVKKTSTFSNSSTYGTNFKVEASGGIEKVFKVGAEFGTTTTSQKANSFTYETTDANDILGGALLNWKEPIVVTSKKFFGMVELSSMGTISTGSTRIGVETVRIAQ